MVEVEAYNGQGDDQHDDEKDEPCKHVRVDFLQCVANDVCKMCELTTSNQLGTQ